MVVLGRQALIVFALLIWVLAGCAVYQSPQVERIALLAPFEGRDRMVGYQALYAARMAIAETERIDIELYAIDDGGTASSALDRARALHNDQAVSAVIALGRHATTPHVTALLEPKPTIIVGEWEPVMDIADDQILAEAVITTPSVDELFRERYTTFDPFAPEPLPLAEAVYKATQELLAAR